MKIRFSHYYQKFWLKEAMIEDGDVVELVGVSVCDREQLPKSFLHFDSNYGSEGEPEYFPLPAGRVIVLFFWDGDDLFSTIRRWTPQKEEYYRNGIGKLFEVKIEEHKTGN